MFLVDSNIFIEAQNRYYAQDIVPAFWDWLDSVFGNDLATIENVFAELTAKDDELSRWIEARKGSAWILKTDDNATQAAFGRIANELIGSSYSQPAVAKFLSGADPWLIAKAETMGASIVTHETSNPHAKSRVPIPNLCLSRRISIVNTYEVLRLKGAKFRI